MPAFQLNVRNQISNRLLFTMVGIQIVTNITLIAVFLDKAGPIAVNETGPNPEQLGRIPWREQAGTAVSGLKRGNEPDMPMITHDRLWFLQENRFYFSPAVDLLK